jgi:hypothetical protein
MLLNVKTGCLVVLAAAAVAAPAQAVDIGADVHLGTMGPGVGVAVQVTRNLNVRGGLNAFTYDSFDLDDEEGLEYNAELELNNQYVMADWYPSRRSKFRITAGMFVNGNEGRASAEVVSDGEAQVGPRDAAAGTRVDATVSFDNASGYLGVGYGNVFGRGGRFSFGLDLGIVYQGEPIVDMVVTLPESLENCDSSQEYCITEEDVDAEREDVEAELSDFDTLPLVNLSFGFRF